MLGIVVSGHIHFASGMKSAVEAISGKQKQLQFVDYDEVCTEVLKEKLILAAQQVNSGDGVLFLTDILGGSPTNCAMSLLVDNSDYELICGVNLSMIVNACFERDCMTLDELKEALLNGEMSCIKDMRKEFETALLINTNVVGEEGI